MKCDHPSCHCLETKVQSNGRKYCSQACANAVRSGDMGPACTCGHAGCS
jgi:hypothetical protein